ncbi:hypothetical protein [Nocardioides mangrovi]|uniref:Histidine kinase n=1 Tax=Nocardioides mangrovi TaxID=2874580 RepID=A0ABS7U8J3_9ACTN|nr:hypothetical protein [Nocardioides mangrovi]MBZ5737266.1 hypothetical protein [Nocardioides mangrovi]
MRGWAEGLGDLTASQLVLRGLVLLGPVVAVLATGPAGSWAPWWVLLPILALAVGFAALPESSVGIATYLAVLAWWTLALEDGLDPMVLVAVVALVVSHVAAVLASYGPGEMPVHGPLVRRWAVRGALVLLVVPPTWLLGRGLRDDTAQHGIWVTGVAVALAATLAAAVALAGSDREAQP